MSATSLVKFFSQHSPTGHKAGGGPGDTANKVYWGRADRDGAPFIGPYAPNMPEEEYEERVTRVAYPMNGFFDVTNPEENAQYLEVIDCCLNNWFQLIYLQRWWNRTTKHYVEWAAYYMQDGSRLSLTPFKQQQPVLGVDGGQANGIIYPQHGTQ